MPLKIMIGIPVSDSIPGLFVGYFGSIISDLTRMGHYVGLSISDKVPLDMARENILRKTIESRAQYDYLLWLDTDMCITSDHVFRMLQYMEVHTDTDAVSGLYFRKGGNFAPTAFHLRDNPKRERGFDFETIHPKDGTPIQIGAVGMGCMLMCMKAFRAKLMAQHKPEEPYFKFDGEGEDMYFCNLMRKAGMKLMLLPEIEVPHMGGTVGKWHYDKAKDGEPKIF